MKQHNQNVDQKKGSADRDVSGTRKGMPGGAIGRNEAGIDHSRNAGGRSDEGGSEGNSRERKGARTGSDSNES
jgi:hypothetical protein